MKVVLESNPLEIRKKQRKAQTSKRRIHQEIIACFIINDEKGKYFKDRNTIK